jgi:hypothetical protein
VFVPGLLLRLGRDGESYDFMERKCTGGLESLYRLLARAEALSLAHAAMLVLLKLRVLRDLRACEQASRPRARAETACRVLPRNPLIPRRRSYENRREAYESDREARGLGGF